MKFMKKAVFLLLILILAACSVPEINTAWPEPRPLGKNLPTVRERISEKEVLHLEEPRGDLSLRQALALALMKNPELASFAWQVRAQEAKVLQAKLLPNPELGFEMENFGGQESLRGIEEAEITLSLSMLIELGGKRYKRTKVALLERNLAEWDYEAKRLEILSAVTKAFIQVVAAQEQLRLSEELLRIAKQVFNAVKERVEAGKVSPIEQTRASVILSTSKIELEKAKLRLEAARKQLASFWGSSKPLFKRARGTLERILPLPSEQDLIALLSQNPEIARWATELELRRSRLELEKAHRIPDITIGGGLRRLNELESNAFVMEVSLPLPLFNQNQGAILQARYELLKARFERKSAEIKVKRKLAEIYKKLSSAYFEVLTLKKEVLPAAKKAFEAIMEGYKEGKFGFLEVLDAQRTLFDQRLRYIEALASYHSAVAELEGLIGVSLKEILKDISQPKNQEG